MRPEATDEARASIWPFASKSCQVFNLHASFLPEDEVKCGAPQPLLQMPESSQVPQFKGRDGAGEHRTGRGQPLAVGPPAGAADSKAIAAPNLPNLPQRGLLFFQLRAGQKTHSLDSKAHSVFGTPRLAGGELLPCPHPWSQRV